MYIRPELVEKRANHQQNRMEGTMEQQQQHNVTITGVNIPFWNLVGLFLYAFLAMIPTLVILTVGGLLFSTCFIAAIRG